MSRLYEITEQFAELAKLADTDDEGMAIAVQDTLQAVAGEFDAKATAIASVLLNMDGDVEAIETAIERLQARKKAIQGKQDSIRDYLRYNMDAAGIKKISCPLFAISCVEGREIAVITDEAALPDEFVNVKTSIVPDKAAITKALKEGVDVSGAHLERAKSSLRIK